MAVAAIAYDTGVIKNSRQPSSAAMTIFTDIATGDMCWRFSGCRGAVMTADAISNNTNMIEIRRYPGSRCMAIVTGVRAGNMRR